MVDFPSDKLLIFKVSPSGGILNKKLSDVCSVSKAGSIHCSINPEERRMQVNCQLKLFSGH